MIPKLRKEIRWLERQGTYPLDLSPRDKVFFIGDSKIDHLKSQIDPSDGNTEKIRFLGKKGSKITKKEFFKIELLQKLPRYRSPIVIVWFGTCEFTKKESVFIELEKNLDTVFTNLKEKYTKLKEKILRINSRSKVIFLDVPYLSVITHNAKKGHENLSEFDGNDDQVNSYIEQLNQFTKELNGQYRSPRLSQDTIQWSKRRGQRPRSTKNYSAYRDGVHPDVTLARLWLLRVYRLIANVAEDNDLSSD